MRSVFRAGGAGVKASREDVLKARALRANATSHERRLWYKLCELNRLGHHFRRQAPFGPCILDFVEHGAKLAVELDGSEHGMAENVRRDEQRDAFLRGEGYAVLRFWNYEVGEDVDRAVDVIVRTLDARRATPSPHPKNAAHFSASPRGGGKS